MVVEVILSVVAEVILSVVVVAELNLPVVVILFLSAAVGLVLSSTDERDCNLSWRGQEMGCGYQLMDYPQVQNTRLKARKH